MTVRRRVGGKAPDAPDATAPELELSPETEQRIADRVDEAARAQAVENGRGAAFVPFEPEEDSYGNPLPALDDDGEDEPSDEPSEDEDSDSEEIVFEPDLAPAIASAPVVELPFVPTQAPPLPPKTAPRRGVAQEKPMFGEPGQYDEREHDLHDDEPSSNPLFDEQPHGPVEVPLWAESERYPKTFQLRVERLRDSGIASYLGEIHTQATMNQILAKWPFPGTFLLWPVDNLGAKITKSPLRFDVDPAHEFFRTHPVGGGPVGAGAPAVGAIAALSPEAMKLIEMEKAEAKEARQEAERIRLDAEAKKAEWEKTMRERETELREREMALSLNTAENIQQSATKMFDGHEKRTMTVIDMMRVQADNEAKRQEIAMERERERAKADAAAQIATLTSLQSTILTLNAETEKRRMEMDREREKERNELAREREKERNQMMKDREERLAREEDRLRERADERDRDRREHMERMTALNGTGGTGSLVQQVEGVRKVMDALELGGEKEPKGVVGEVVDAYKEIQIATLEVKKMQAQAKLAMAQAGASPEEIDDEFEDDDDDDGPGTAQAVQRFPVPAQLGGGFILPPLAAGQPPRLQPPPGLNQEQTNAWAQNVAGWMRQQAAAQAQARIAAGGPTQQIPAQSNVAPPAPQAPTVVAVQAGSPQVSPQPVQNASPNAAPTPPAAPGNGQSAASSPEQRIAQLPLPVQKEGRATCREIVKALVATGDDRSKWGEIIMGALKASPITLEFLKAATVYGATVEAARAERIEGPEFLASDVAMQAEPFANQVGIPVRP